MQSRTEVLWIGPWPDRYIPNAPMYQHTIHLYVLKREEEGEGEEGGRGRRRRRGRKRKEEEEPMEDEEEEEDKAEEEERRWSCTGWGDEQLSGFGNLSNWYGLVNGEVH
ncbi:hypothetical protein BHE74_00047892 [Ensete ventricosum]|nr:hypothetical protein BHE74_00047892 [Ensete ventricosum]